MHTAAEGGRGELRFFFGGGGGGGGGPPPPPPHLFIRLICCVWSPSGCDAEKQNLPSALRIIKKPAAVCNHCGLSPPSVCTQTHTPAVHKHTSTHPWLKQKTPTGTAREHRCAHTHTHTPTRVWLPGKLAERRRDQRVEQSFSPHLHDRSLHPIIWRRGQRVSLSSADERE